MLLISAADYRSACKQLVSGVLIRPQMYFRNLSEFETFLRGHEAAFEQLASINRNESFHAKFSNWLHKNKGLSCAGGWALAIEEQGQKVKCDSLVLFREYVGAFFDCWNDNGEVGHIPG